MDATAHYRQLAQRGRDAFLAGVAPAALVRRIGTLNDSDYDGVSATGTYDEPVGERRPRDEAPEDDALLEVLPLLKKRGAPFGDRITVGRTTNNDVVLPHHTVSRLHVYFREHQGRWFITDAGSKNGTTLRDEDLSPRRETEILDGDPVWIGDVACVFHTASTLFGVLGGQA